MRVFSYRVVRDYGFAPNPFHGTCTLATCKPGIRGSAAVGDIVVGCGSSATGLLGRVVYAMRVTGKCGFDEYWDDPRFREKRPFFGGSRSRAYGDNIYHRDGEGRWLQERSHHSHADGRINEENLRQDTSKDNVLWSDDFAYFGREGPFIPEYLRAHSGRDLFPSGRGHRAYSAPEFTEAVGEWFVALPVRGYLGRPWHWK